MRPRPTLHRPAHPGDVIRNRSTISRSLPRPLPRPGLNRALGAVLASIVLLLTGCGDAGPFPGRGSDGLVLPRGIPATQLPEPASEGARLTSEFCAGCHGIPSPRRHTAGDWDVVVRRMVRHMERMERHMGGGMGGMMMGGSGTVEVPTAEERERILAYLGRNALEAARPDELPPSEGRELFAEACARCHALPDPAQHAPSEWTDVVRRMQRTAREMEVDGISDTDAASIAAYLREASGGER